MLGASSAPFWFSAFFLALMPTSIGYQDLAALLAQQPGVSQRWRDHLDVPLFWQQWRLRSQTRAARKAWGLTAAELHRVEKEDVK